MSSFPYLFGVALLLLRCSSSNDNSGTSQSGAAGDNSSSTTAGQAGALGSPTGAGGTAGAAASATAQSSGASGVGEAGASGSPSNTGGANAGGANGGGAAGSSTHPLTCGTNAWASYGHDARRSSASDGCILGPLKFLWRYVPTPPQGKKVIAVYSAIAQSDGVFLSWGVTGIPFGTTQALDRITPAGANAWSFVPGFGDWSTGQWASTGLGAVMYSSDGLYWLDPANGKPMHGYGVDYWGQTATDGSRMYTVNTWFVDGPKTFVGAYDSSGKQLWNQNSYGTTRGAPQDRLGALAVDGAITFYAPNYCQFYQQNCPPSPATGVYAFDSTAGTPKWSQTTMPVSAISAGSGAVYLIEGGASSNPNTRTGMLVARDQMDGKVRWSKPVSSLINQHLAVGGTLSAPVLTAGLVIVPGDKGVDAYHTADGTLAWQASVMPIPLSSFLAIDTTLAVAEGSGTLVAVAPDKSSTIHILSLKDGKEVWSGVVSSAKGALKNPVVVGKRLYLTDMGDPTQPGDGGVLALESP